MLNKGIIVSIQGYTEQTTIELAYNAYLGGAVAIRTDKNIRPVNGSPFIPIIGLKKSVVKNPAVNAYITTTIEDIENVSRWADYVAIDYRMLNKNLENLQAYCKDKQIKVVADIGTIEDVHNILENDYYFTYIATTFNIFYGPYYRNSLLCYIKEEHPDIKTIGEGGYTLEETKEAFKFYTDNVCVGEVISDIKKLTEKFTGVVK